MGKLRTIRLLLEFIDFFSTLYLGGCDVSIKFRIDYKIKITVVVTLAYYEKI